VALNTAITFRRKAIRRAAPSVPVAEDTIPSAQRGPRRELDILQEFVASLGKVDRAIFLLYLDDLSYEDMADITGLQKNNIGVRINRIKKAFVERYIGS
jgi:RNA polymerase sigma-70 factor (ECF subfamily)